MYTGFLLQVIQMKEVTPASDIWGVGCLVVELLTRRPPYFDLQPASAMYRIVHDTLAPIPPTLPTLATQFVSLCFTKVSRALRAGRHHFCCARSVPSGLQNSAGKITHSLDQYKSFAADHSQRHD